MPNAIGTCTATSISLMSADASSDHETDNQAPCLANWDCTGKCRLMLEGVFRKRATRLPDLAIDPLPWPAHQLRVGRRRRVGRLIATPPGGWPLLAGALRGGCPASWRTLVGVARCHGGPTRR
jgi:hypothetical protein